MPIGTGAPKRKVATQAAKNIHHQYTDPFPNPNPRPRSRRPPNTATRYEREDMEFVPGGYLHQSYGHMFPEVFARNVVDQEIDEESPTLAPDPSIVRNRKRVRVTKKSGKTGVGNSSQVMSDSRDRYLSDEAGPSSHPPIAPRKPAQPLVPKSSRATLVEAVERKSPHNSVPIDIPTPSTSANFQILGESSPFTHRSSSEDAIGEPDPYFTNDRQASAPVPRSPSPPYPPALLPLRWWTHTSPHPSSSPSESPLSDLPDIAEADLLAPMDSGGSELRHVRELSESVSSIKWSPHSSRQSPISQEDSSRSNVEIIRVPLLGVPGINFTPRSQAFQVYGAGGLGQFSNRISVQPIESDIQPGLPDDVIGRLETLRALISDLEANLAGLKRVVEELEGLGGGQDDG